MECTINVKKICLQHTNYTKVRQIKKKSKIGKIYEM